jgi:hypothetical protein
MSLTYDTQVTYGSLTYDAAISVSVLEYAPGIVYLPPTGTGPQGTLVPPPSVAANYSGEALIRETIRKTLDDLDDFDFVWVGGRLDYAKQRIVPKSASVQAVSTREVRGYDSGPGNLRIFRSQIKIGIYVSNVDTEVRDATASMLLDAVRKTLDYTCIAGLTCPELTKIESWEWHGDTGAKQTPTQPDIAPPVREIEAILSCDWLQGA